jgi:Icc-related predicted phosphoesterase
LAHHIFICHAPLYGQTDKADYAHTGSEALLRYVKEKQPRYVYHGHVHSAIGTMIGKSAVVFRLRVEDRYIRLKIFSFF